MSYNFVLDLEYDLMKYCVKWKGKWWAKILRIIVNKEVKDLYDKLRGLEIGTVRSIIVCGCENYQMHIDYYNKVVCRFPTVKI